MDCAACGNANPAGAKFCNECGTPLAAPGGQEVRKTVTVLFADLVGFTSLSERLDQESLRRVMDRFYEEMRGAVHAHGGTVAKFIGDAVMAVWGTPAVREDDALRAVRAAEEMRGALAALNLDLEHRWGVRVGMRTGVNTGEVVVDPTKPADLLVGDTLNVAARLEQAAADGEILAGPETYRLVRDLATFEPVEPLQLKGKTRRLRAYRVVDGLRPERRRGERLRAPLVGREDEVARLRTAFEAAVAAGATRLVTVIGSPGVGKTRLARELAARLAGEARVLHGHCEPATEGATFLPVAEVLRDAAGIEEGDAVREKLAAAIPGEEDPRVLDAAAAVLGEGAPVAAEETFWAVRRFLEALARERPLVVVLDDIHWGEPTFLDLVEHLAAWGRDAPVLLVASARPELRDARPGLAAPGAVTFDALALEPLAPEASRALVDGLLGAADLPPELAERLLGTADGNPLFLGEMLRMLVEDGVLRRDGDTWVVAETEDVSVPPTIQALLAVRLERLPVAERTIVQHAAVIGPLFSRDAVAELAGEPAASEVDEHLDALRRKELIAPAEGSADGPAFRFGHALIRDAAYRPLLKEARAELHERFAGWLEARGAEQDEIVGFHLERAYGYRRELGPLDDAARELGGRAGARLRAAGRRALEREDLPAATNLLGRALEVLEDGDPARAEALLELAEALLSAGDTARGVDVVEEVTMRADAAGDARLLAHATVLSGQLANLVAAGGVRDTIARVQEAGRTLADVGDAAGVAKAHHVVAGAHALLGEVAATEAALDRALVAARTAGDRRRVTAVLSGAPRAALWGPSPVVRASGRCLDVVRIVRMTPGNRHVEAMALRCQAVLEAMRGRADAGRAILRDGRAALEELGLTLELHELDTYAGIVELLAGDAAAAEQRLRAARDGYAELGVDTGAGHAAALLARALLEQGRDAEAVALTEQAEQRAGEDLKTAIAWRGVRAEALARRGDHADAQRLAREAVALTEPTDALADKADALMTLAAVLRACDDADGAAETAARARELYAEKEHEAGLARAAAAVGRPAAPAAPTPLSVATLGGSEPEQVIARCLELANARDWERLRDAYHEDLHLIDHTPDGADVPDRDAFLDALTNLTDLIPDFRWHVAKVFATSPTVGAFVLEVVADSVAGGGGPVANAFGQVVTIADGRLARIELFAPDDEAAILARFEELRAEATSPAHRTLDAILDAINAQDWDRLRDLSTPDYRAVDHRPEGAHMDVDELVSAFRVAAEFLDRPRWDVVRVLASGDSHLAYVLELSGDLREGGAPARLAYGNVVTIRGGLSARLDIFDPDDEAAILARFEELRAEADLVRVAPGVDPAHPAITALRAHCERHAARDWQGFAALYAPDYEGLDRRPLGWERVDRAAAVELNRTAVDVAPDAVVTTEVLAVGDAISARIHEFRGHAADGGGEVDVTLGAVAVHADGLIAREEFLDADRDAILARFDELLVERAPTPTLRTAAEYVRRYNARDWAGLRELFADDIEHRDHREVGLWHVEGADDLVAQLAQTAQVTPDVRASLDVLAHDTGLLATRHRWNGTFEGAPMEVRVGQVTAVQDGRYVRIEQFEPDDDAAIMARFEELRREHDPVRLAPGVDPEHPVVERVRTQCHAYNRRDWDGFRALFAPGYDAVDRRAVGWERLDRDSLMETGYSAVAVAPDMTTAAEVLACGPAVVARLQHYRGHAADGGGLLDVGLGGVTIYDDEGRVAREEFFEPEDRDAILARFDDLLVELAPSPGQRIEAEFTRCLNARDWDRLRALYADDLVYADHRDIGLWDFEGPDDLVAQLRASADLTPDGRASSELIADGGTVIADRLILRATYEGAPLEVRIGQVLGIRDGVCVSAEAFEADDEAAILARFEELRRADDPVAVAPGVDPEEPAIALWRAVANAVNARDWARLRALMHDEYEMHDQRTAGTWSGTRGPDDVVENLRAVTAVSSDFREVAEVIVADGDVSGAREAVRGRALDGGGALEVATAQLRVARDGLLWRVEMFDPADEEALLARFEELLAERDPVRCAEGVDPAHPQVDVARRRCEAFNRRDWDAFAGFLAPDYESVDHRVLGGGRLDRESAAENVQAAAGVAQDLRQTTEVLAVDDRVVARVLEFHGHADHGGGAAHVDFGSVVVFDDEGRVRREELFDPDDRERIVARFEELRAERTR